MTYVISDVDGVINTGQFLYNEDGKKYKVFGPHDADGVKLLAECGIMTIFISADKRGYEITKRRILDMNSGLYFVPEQDRTDFIKNQLETNECYFIGDGFYDAVTLSKIKNNANFKGALTHHNAVGHMIREVNNLEKGLVITKDPGDGFFFSAAMWIISQEDKMHILESKFRDEK